MDFAWKYSKQIAGEKYFRCRFCDQICSGGVTRLKKHLAKALNGGIKPCPKAPESVVLECKNVLDAFQQDKKSTKKAPPSPPPPPQIQSAASTSRKREKEEARKKKQEEKIEVSRLFGRFYFSQKSRDVNDPYLSSTSSPLKKRPKIGDAADATQCYNEVTTQQEVEVGNQAVESIIRKGSPPNLRVNSSPTSLAAADAVGKDCTCDEVELPTHSTGSQDASVGNIAGVSETDCRRENAKMAITKISYDGICDAQPLHMCSGGIELDDSRISSGGTMNQWNEARESHVGLPRIDCTDNKVPRLNSKLPFVKSSPIWEMIDSMEVFQAMQQNPHFHPLFDFTEERREGLAIGHMVTFANLVEKTCKLHFDDPRSIWVSYLEVLLDLEMHGFEVQVLRNRLNELLAIKDEQEQNLDKLKKCESQLLEDVNKRSKIDEEIDEFNKQIREFKEKQALARSIKKIQDTEISTLQLSVDDIREGMRNTQLDFGRAELLGSSSEDRHNSLLVVERIPSVVVLKCVCGSSGVQPRSGMIRRAWICRISR